MPRRPRQHVLEDESRVALRGCLNRVGWRFEDFDSDYGVDGLVEIFDRDYATGLTFNVQIKATDSTSPPRAVRLPVETFEYYRSLEPPVLIVRYHAASEDLYARWVHSFDPYYGGANEKSISIGFTEADAWNDDTPVLLRRELEAYRRFRSPEIPLPVRFFVEIDESLGDGWIAAKCVLELRSAAEGLVDVIRIERGPASPGDAVLRIRQDEVVANFSGVKSFSVHDLDLDLGVDTWVRTSHDLLAVIAGGFAVLGQSNLSARVAEVAAAHTTLFVSPGVVFALAGAMSRARRVPEALRVANTLLDRVRAGDDEGLRIAASMFSIAPVAQPGRLTEPELSAIRSLHDRLIADAADSGAEAVASAHYNLANHLRGARNPRDALRHYRRAANNDRSYCERPYFCTELAGCAFEAERYRLSIAFYRRAIELGAPDDVRALLGDALLYAGRLEEAAVELGLYERSVEAPRPEWRLKLWILEVIGPRVGAVHERDTRRAQDLEERALAADIGEREEMLRSALEADMLYGNAWFNLAVLYWEAGRLDEALYAFLIAAGLLRHDTESWRNVIPFVWAWDREHETPLVGGLRAADLFDAAWNLNGHAMSAALVDAFSSLTEPALRQEAGEWLEQQEARQAVASSGFKLRFPALGPEAVFDFGVKSGPDDDRDDG